MENFQDQEFAHGNPAPVLTIVPADGENAFLQASVPEADDKTLLHMRQSFAKPLAVVHGKWRR
jgi:hypothetical protein